MEERAGGHGLAAGPQHVRGGLNAALMLTLGSWTSGSEISAGSGTSGSPGANAATAFVHSTAGGAGTWWKHTARPEARIQLAESSVPPAAPAAAPVSTLVPGVGSARQHHALAAIVQAST